VITIFVEQKLSLFHFEYLDWDMEKLVFNLNTKLSVIHFFNLMPNLLSLWVSHYTMAKTRILDLRGKTIKLCHMSDFTNMQPNKLLSF
jgi:hypothetical protein